MRYATFISYNHHDRKAAAWLHRALETYRIPKRLRGRDSAVGRLGARLPPIFQDREELAASADLAASVREALIEASSMIVVCSPAGARSRWVNEEIRAFAALGRRDRVQCLIVSGTPNASRTAGLDPALECLPPALFEHGGGEPLAADIRPGQDGRSAARLKLLAGVMGVPYDELRQREQHRRQRRLVIVATASAFGFAGMSGLATVALISRQEAIAQRDIARQKTLTAERTVDFVKSMFAVADPSEARGATITAREVLDRGAARLGDELANEPTVKAELGTTLGEVYTNLGMLRQGDALIRQGLALPGVDPGTRARQYLALGETRVWQADDAGAIRAFERALRIARDPRVGRSELVPRILVGLGDAQSSLDLLDMAAANARRALALDRARRPAVAGDIARDLEALGAILYAQGELPAARRSIGEALTLRRAKQSALHPRSLQDLNQLGSIAYMQGDRAAAETFYREALPLAERVLGRDHPQVAALSNNLARVLVERRDYGPAIPLLDHAIKVQITHFGADAADLAFYRASLGIALAASGRILRGQAELREARRIAELTHHRSLGPTLVDLAHLACRNGSRREGVSLAAEALPVLRKAYPHDPWRMGWQEFVVAECEGSQKAMRDAAAIVGRKWPSGTHYGEEMRQAIAAARTDQFN